MNVLKEHVTSVFRVEEYAKQSSDCCLLHTVLGP
jgi:hypothetical protein